MKKAICLVVSIVILVVLASCGSKLPKGEASKIDFTNGWEIHESTFEYINENTIKIVRVSDGQVFYVPDSSIEMI